MIHTDPSEEASLFRSQFQLSYPTSKDELASVCARLGASVRYGRGGNGDSGFLRREISGYTIWINRETAARRQLFTLAHEIGHLLHRRAGTYLREEEERWCNSFAAEVLMPAEYVPDNPRDGLVLPLAIDLAEESGASLVASLIRTNEVHGAQNAIITLVRFGTGWIISDVAGLPEYVSNQLSAPPAATPTLDALTPGVVTISDLPTALGSRIGNVRAEVVTEEDFAVAVFARDQLTGMNSRVGSPAAS